MSPSRQIPWSGQPCPHGDVRCLICDMSVWLHSDTPAEAMAMSALCHGAAWGHASAGHVTCETVLWHARPAPSTASPLLRSTSHRSRAGLHLPQTQHGAPRSSCQGVSCPSSRQGTRHSSARQRGLWLLLCLGSVASPSPRSRQHRSLTGSVCSEPSPRRWDPLWETN